MTSALNKEIGALAPDGCALTVKPTLLSDFGNIVLKIDIEQTHEGEPPVTHSYCLIREKLEAFTDYEGSVVLGQNETLTPYILDSVVFRHV